MSQQVTIEVSENVARRAERVAAQTRRSVADVLAAWLETVVEEPPVEELSDDDLLALAESQFDERRQQALSDLLERNREGALDAEEQRRLDEIMRLYERELLRKSQTMRVAVKRGLLAPLAS